MTKQRQNYKGFQHKSRRKMPEIKMGTTGQERCHTEGTETKGGNSGGAVGRKT
jgi:hypothetical protein